MSEQIKGGMNVLKKIFLVLLILDAIGLVSVGISLFPTFKMLADYGKLMLIVAGVIFVVIVVVLLFEIVAKIFLIWRSSADKKYVGVARFLIVFNLAAFIFTLLSLGGEGATLINQARMWLQILASLVEVITALCYLRAVKKL